MVPEAHSEKDLAEQISKLVKVRKRMGYINPNIDEQQNSERDDIDKT